uniref:Cytochrome P450 n=1 Tax=Caenorhabditis japonica TaxID=281687 RepID=A0A8R1DN82_CAEJA
MYTAIFTAIIIYFLLVAFRKRRELLEFWRVRRVCNEQFEKLTGPPAVPIFGSTWYFKKDPIIFDSSVNISKSSQYEKLKEWIGDGLLISTNEKWRSRRKMLTQTFHFAVLKDYQKVFTAQGKTLVEVLQFRADNMNPIDILPYIKRCTLDIICGRLRSVAE